MPYVHGQFQTLISDLGDESAVAELRYLDEIIALHGLIVRGRFGSYRGS